MAPPLVVKQKPVGFSPKATSPPKRDQQSSPLSPDVPKPEPVKREHSFEETIFKVWILSKRLYEINVIFCYNCVINKSILSG